MAPKQLPVSRQMEMSPYALNLNGIVKFDHRLRQLEAMIKLIIYRVQRRVNSVRSYYVYLYVKMLYTIEN